jgi:cytochrome P450
VINHPTYLEHIQKHNSKNYVRGTFARNAFQSLHRNGIFVADGKDWQVQRKAATRAFSKKNFESHITNSLHHWLDILMRLLSKLADQQTEFDFQALMGRLTFSLFLRIAFHEDKIALEVLSDDPACLGSMPAFVEAYDQATHRTHPLYFAEMVKPLLTSRYSSVRSQET